MRMIVFGAAGRTGRAVVEQACASGHDVTAFVRVSDDSDFANVASIAGDATNRSDVQAAVCGQDAVIDTIGGKAPYRETILEESAAAIIVSSMLQNGVRRLIATSMLGVGDSEANTPIYTRLLVSTFLRGAGKDKAAMEAEIASSGLDWTIVRPAILNDHPAQGSIRVLSSEMDEKAHSITRGDVASFIVAQLSNGQYLRQFVTIANS